MDFSIRLDCISAIESIILSLCHCVAIKFWQSKVNGRALVIPISACIVGFIKLSALYFGKMASQFHQEITPQLFSDREILSA